MDHLLLCSRFSRYSRAYQMHLFLVLFFLVLFQIGEMRGTSRFPQFNRYRPPRRCLAWYVKRWAVANMSALTRTFRNVRYPVAMGW